MDASQRDVLRGALEALTHDGSVASVVPIDIGDSWRRSLDSGLAPDRFDVPSSDSFESDGPLAHAARPILRTLGAELADVGISMILADDHGQVLDRHVTDKALMSGLDEILLAPGFVYSERGVGTNGIGTALAQHAPTFVRGAEHFSEGLTTWACAGAPIIDPCTGRVVGVIDLTCRERCTESPHASSGTASGRGDLPAPHRQLRADGTCGASKLLAAARQVDSDWRSSRRVASSRMRTPRSSSAVPTNPTLWFVAAQTLDTPAIANGASHPQLRANDTTSMRTGGRWQHADRRARTHRQHSAKTDVHADPGNAQPSDGTASPPLNEASSPSLRKG